MAGRLSGTLAGPDGRFSPKTARVLLAIGCALMLMGTLLLQRGLPRIAFGTRGVARVVARTQPAPTSYIATLEFEPPGGPVVRIDRRLTSRRAGPLSPGERIGVAYFSRSPQAAEIMDSRADWAGGSIPLVVGAILAALSRAYRRRESPHP